jgi:hypothetical protein
MVAIYSDNFCYTNAPQSGGGGGGRAVSKYFLFTKPSFSPQEGTKNQTNEGVKEEKTKEGKRKQKEEGKTETKKYRKEGKETKDGGNKKQMT